MIKKLVLSIFVFMSCIAAINTNAQTLEEEFRKLNESRSLRKELISYLKTDDVVVESIDGLLQAPKDAKLRVQAIVSQENKDRKRQFEIIAQNKGVSVKEVAMQFAKKMGVDVNQAAETVLVLHGSNTIGGSLMPALVEEFLETKGAVGIVTARDGVETRIRFKSVDSDSSYKEVEIIAHGSSTAFQETDSNKSVGLLGGYCDIGMASRSIKSKEAQVLMDAGKDDLRLAGKEYPIAVDGVAIIVHPSNAVKTLSTKQVADIFSGAISNWGELGGKDLPIKLYARDAQSGTFDTFKSKVLKPNKVKLRKDSIERFEDTARLRRKVAADQSGIGFIGLASLNSTVKSLLIKAADNTRPLKATRLTIKSLDYPLSRLLYLYAPSSRKAMADELIEFIMSDDGQAAVDRHGLIGQGRALEVDQKQADELKSQLLSDNELPEEYRSIIRKADRRDTAANVRFSSGSNDPDVNSNNNILRLSSFLANFENADVEVVLIGFADNKGGSSGNLSLSLKRAESVAEILRSQGVQAISTHGFGEAMPVGDNASESGRAANRRVEIWLKR